MPLVDKVPRSKRYIANSYPPILLTILPLFCFSEVIFRLVNGKMAPYQPADTTAQPIGELSFDLVWLK